MKGVALSVRTPEKLEGLGVMGKKLLEHSAGQQWA